ncbi:hypothetical protein C8A05DRAFT_34026 [Staphylotrichum tortipilum]|uniref:F-box domain-containing protein n=1 Tax=Staphylotrichum tortipilum TaxID=2831512 RepID=A0AAN6MJW9_9PEZI|nr:hypothetical protein C8A05DRAFT_34026 [Staphylotrichum longicolle]
MALALHAPEYFTVPARMCWLCRREGDARRHNRSHRQLPPGVFIEITLPDGVDGREKPASLSVIILQPERAISHNAGMRSRPLSHTEGPAAAASQHQHQDPSTGTDTTTTTAACPVYNKAAKMWTFRVHAECWTLASRRIADPVGYATTWCKSLISTNWSFSGVTPASKTDRLPPALVSTVTPYGTNYRSVSMHRLEDFDGLAGELGVDRVPTVHRPVPLEALDLPCHPSPAQAPSFWPTQATDAFSVLPEELLQQIIQDITTADLLSLRRASRTACLVSRVGSLPQSFWRSRFTPRFEMGFALPEKVGSDVDWRGMYFLTRRALLRQCVVFPSMDSPLLTRLAKRRYWWERLRRSAEMHDDWEWF